MKKTLLILPITIYMASCSGCDMNTADGAANCACDLGQDMVKAIEDEDSERLMKVGDEIEKWQQDASDHMAAGDYTENQLEEALEAKDCDM